MSHSTTEIGVQQFVLGRVGQTCKEIPISSASHSLVFTSIAPSRFVSFSLAPVRSNPDQSTAPSLVPVSAPERAKCSTSKEQSLSSASTKLVWSSALHPSSLAPRRSHRSSLAPLRSVPVQSVAPNLAAYEAQCFSLRLVYRLSTWRTPLLRREVRSKQAP